ncbi:MAG: alpha/beta hydrolase [Pseudanabaenaceae cyanobacterium SKYGB_i_bin29]|nr:alpha/beta hydrolase [Pseudanabaenaceae cyanobacterium SKYG29]MDW8421370.1 alpha/beta hydrolase [Pseudanabaenaceae cyanobacterium SKYGB_i_bin29]
MKDKLEAVIISTSPSNDRLDVSLARYLGKHYSVAQWIYSHSQLDAAISTTEILGNLQNYLAPFPPVHLIGHSLNGMLAFLYAQKFPDRVLSLTLLAVGKNMAMNWIAQYYFNLHFLPICRNCLLEQMAINLFGYRSPSELYFYVQLLEQDLTYGFSPHSPFQLACQKNEPIPVPLCVCGSEDDFICDPDTLSTWQPLLKDDDQFYLLPAGKHYFHHFQVETVSSLIQDFWQATQT